MGRLEHMRLLAVLAEAGSLTAAGRALGLPKQTVSRRLAALEAALGVRLVHRTARRLRLTDVGAAYAERCAEVVRLADEADEAVARASGAPAGTLRITATEALAEAFVAPVVSEYLARWPSVRVEVLLAERRVDLVAEGFDVGVRVGALEDSTLIATRLGPARIRLCASPAYLARRPTSEAPSDLATHDCIVNGADARLARWPFTLPDGGTRVVSVPARVAVNHVGFLRRACLDGLGIALLPEFLVAGDLRAGTLVSLLDPFLADVGSVWLVTPSRRFLAPRVRAFLDLARAVYARQFPEW